MMNAINEEDVKAVLEAIEVIEEGNISFFNFDFIEDREIAQRLNRDINDIIPILERLRNERMVMLIDKDNSDKTENNTAIEKYLVKSKIAHIF